MTVSGTPVPERCCVGRRAHTHLILNAACVPPPQLPDPPAEIIIPADQRCDGGSGGVASASSGLWGNTPCPCSPVIALAVRSATHAVQHMFFLGGGACMDRAVAKRGSSSAWN